MYSSAGRPGRRWPCTAPTHARTHARTHTHTQPVSFQALDLSTLRTYAAQYDLKVRRAASKHELAERVREHFASLTVDENKAIAFFVTRLREDFE